MAIELTGRINEKGELEVDLPEGLQPGEVHVVIQPVSAEELAADDAMWDEQFAKSQDALGRMADEALKDYDEGRTTELDPDKL
jgi:hypothetical protein